MALSFSILTPTFNRRALLADAVRSVSAQNWPEVEHLIADGGSDDGTLEMLATAERVHVLAGPDDGIYDALNKAVAAAHGEIIGWLNSDDLYAPGAFAAAASAFEANPDLAAVCGGVQIEASGKVERCYPPDCVVSLAPDALLIGPTLPNAWFFRKQVFEQVGLFSRNLRYAADSDFMQRFAKLSPSVAAVPALFYRYRRHEGSATLRDNTASEAVRADMLRLAEMWRDDRDAAVRAVARALEGRCRAALAIDAMRRGDLSAAIGHLARGGEIARGVLDYVARRTAPTLRRRRLGVRSSDGFAP